jgi:hypothetical protein
MIKSKENNRNITANIITSHSSRLLLKHVDKEVLHPTYVHLFIIPK